MPLKLKNVPSCILRQALLLSSIIPDETISLPTSESVNISLDLEPTTNQVDESSASSSGSSSSASSSSTSTSSSTSSSNVFVSPINISPSQVRPSVIQFCKKSPSDEIVLQLCNKSPSDEIKKGKNFKKKCLHPAAEQCTYMFRQGQRKGERCEKVSKFDSKFCNIHLIHNTANITKVQVNRLRRDTKYFYVKTLGFSKFLLQCNGKLFRISLPRAMEHPLKPNKTNYLIRKSSGTVWKKL